MIKIIYPDEQDELLKVAGVLSHFFEDDGSSMKKAASSAFSEKMIRDNAPDNKHFGIHIIAMGCEEKYAFNKNGDSWPEEGLIRRHHTFVKNGHYFKEHRNSDPALAIGLIKASAYNKEMGRVELIVHGDKEKCPEIYEKAKKNAAVDGSMSARVPFDVCSICDKKSASSKNYCAHAKYHMTQWMPQFSKFAYVRNPDPTFFDYSDVANRADRIARHLEFIFNSEDDMQKAASESNRFIFSDERATAEGIILPDDYKQLGCVSLTKQYWLEKLAAEEKEIEAGTPITGYALYEQDALSEEQMAQMNKVHSGVLFRKLAAKSIVLPLLPFAAYIKRQTLKQAAENPAVVGAQAMMPKLFRTVQGLEANADLENAVAAATLFKEASLAPGEEFKKMLDKMQNDFSVEPGTARIRIMQISMTSRPKGKEELGNAQSETEKRASVLSEEHKKEALNLARAYAMYKIAFCEEQMSQQKGVDETKVLLVASQH